MCILPRGVWTEACTGQESCVSGNYRTHRQEDLSRAQTHQNSRHPWTRHPSSEGTSGHHSGRGRWFRLNFSLRRTPKIHIARAEAGPTRGRRGRLVAVLADLQGRSSNRPFLHQVQCTSKPGRLCIGRGKGINRAEMRPAWDWTMTDLAQDVSPGDILVLDDGRLEVAGHRRSMAPHQKPVLCIGGKLSITKA